MFAHRKFMARLVLFTVEQVGDDGDYNNNNHDHDDEDGLCGLPMDSIHFWSREISFVAL